ncbi:opacity protein-like surface antigen [Ancylobacter aquaticus]|uniref:Opacity protein-like surface antigen n=1 Tax=Ancylobacter aquaticus TaxID=100 RepID=A0A4R1HR10_ANCAQ|nr:outer membrane beta-barrel protein [Ancylobacter aquaticus]TCK23185.1 opacity protein-like surface antigen [Ancylobacter aquaticus]
MRVFGALKRGAGLRRGGRLLAAALAVVLLGGAAQAADPIDGLGGDDLLADDLLAMAPEIDEGRNWYLRGDIGYVFNEAADFGAAGHAPLDDAGVFGLGVGARLSDLVRVDITADYRGPADFSTRGISGEASATTVLGNLYLDLGTWHGLTPYVGAGLGASHVSLSGFAPAGVGDADGWGFAWAVTGGVAVTLAPNWQLDLGYRYLGIENVAIDGIFSDLSQSAHEVRLGVRYLFD